MCWKNALYQKQAQPLPCTGILYDKGGTIQRASCLVKVWYREKGITTLRIYQY